MDMSTLVFCWKHACLITVTGGAHTDFTGEYASMLIDQHSMVKKNTAVFIVHTMSSTVSGANLL